MCGLFAVVMRERMLAEQNKFIKLFQQGLYCTALRGTDGTGVLGVSNKGVLDIYKKGLAPSDFIELNKAKKLMENNSNVFLIGHARSSTIGASNCENSHPFSRQHIHLFHNGTLRSHQHLHKNKDVKVDSDSISLAISDCNTREEVSEVLSNLNGSFSLIWYDSEDGTLSFARNSERPLFKATFKNSDSEVYASESGMLIWLAGRVGLEVAEVTPTTVGVYTTIGQKADEIISTTFTPKVISVYDYSEYYPKVGNTSVGDACELPNIYAKGVNKTPREKELNLVTVKLNREDLKEARVLKNKFSFKGITCLGDKVTLNCKNITDRSSIYNHEPNADMYLVATKNCHFESSEGRVLSATFSRLATVHEISRFLINKQKHEDLEFVLNEDDSISSNKRVITINSNKKVLV